MADKRIKELVQAAITAGDFLAVDPAGAGSTYKVPAGQASGLATLDSAGKLAQPRRVLDVQYAIGVTNNPQTTADVHNYILPDPQLSITASGGETVVLIANIAAQIGTAGLRIFARLARSADGGVTWTEIGAYSLIKSSSSSDQHTLAVVATDTPPSGSVLYGIRFGNEVGYSATITAVQVYRSLLAVVVDY